MSFRVIMAKTKKSPQFLTFVPMSIILFVIGLILAITGLALYERDLDRCHYDEKHSLGTIQGSERYNTRCNYCMRLRIKYHTDESGEITTYMIVRTFWSGGFPDLENASASGKTMTVYYNKNRPGTPYQYPEKCRPRGRNLVLMSFGFCMIFVGFICSFLNVRDIPPKNTKTVTSGLVQRIDPIPQPVYGPPYQNHRKDDNYEEEYLTGDTYRESKV